MYIRRLLCISLILLTVIFYCKNSTDPDVITGTYIISRIEGLTVNEYIEKFNERPLIEKIKIEGYNNSDSNYTGKVLFRDIGWFDIEPFKNDKDEFLVYTSEYLLPVRYFWFRIFNISNSYLEGGYTGCAPTIDGPEIQFLAIRKGKFRIRDK
ncbi:hypothetical protein ACFL4T_03575 [candidate division KSB1 bacterium]